MSNEEPISGVAVSVDGEPMLRLDAAAIEQIRERPSAFAHPDMARWIGWASDFVETHAEFYLGRRVVGPRKRELWLLLLSTATGLQRVQIERLACPHCGATSRGANPTEPDLYIGLSSSKEPLDKAWA